MELKSSPVSAGRGALHGEQQADRQDAIPTRSSSVTSLSTSSFSATSNTGAERPADGKVLVQRTVSVGAGAGSPASSARSLVVAVRSALGPDYRDWTRADTCFDGWAKPLSHREPAGGSPGSVQLVIDAASLESLFDELADCEEASQGLVLGVLQEGLVRLRGSGQDAARLSAQTAAVLMDGLARLCLAGAEAASAQARGKPPGLASEQRDASEGLALRWLVRLVRACPELATHAGAAATLFAQAASGLHPQAMKRQFGALASAALGQPRAEGGREMVTAMLGALLSPDAQVPLAALYASACGIADEAVYGPEVAWRYGGSGQPGQPAKPQALLHWGIERFVDALSTAAAGVSPLRVGTAALAMAQALSLRPMPSAHGHSEMALELAVTNALLCMPRFNPAQITSFVAGLYLHVGLAGRDAKELAALRAPMDAAFASLESFVIADTAEVAQALSRGFELAQDPVRALAWSGLSAQAQFEWLELAHVVPSLEDASCSPQAQLQSIASLRLPPVHAWMRGELVLRVAQGRQLAVNTSAWSVLHQALLDRMALEEEQVEAGVEARAQGGGTPEDGSAGKTESKADGKSSTLSSPATGGQPVPSVLARWRVDDMMAFYEELEAMLDVTHLHRKRPGDIGAGEGEPHESQWRWAFDLFTQLRADALRRYGDTHKPLFASIDGRLRTTQGLLRAAIPKAT